MAAWRIIIGTITRSVITQIISSAIRFGSLGSGTIRWSIARPQCEGQRSGRAVGPPPL